MDDRILDELEERVAEILDLPDEQQAAAFAALCARHPEHRDFLHQWQEEVTRLGPGPRSGDSARAERRALVLVEAPERVGDFRILDVLGEGGMGVVYLAEQERPVRRRVALKLIKPGMDSRDVVARFETERQALAMMNHANIARVHEAGLAPDGRPYFVMEHVPGVPITEYCDRKLLGLEERIGIFQKVCRAVQHAHQKGIVHRDLKPGNVLVQELDGLVEPKIIDFGVAKALQQRLTERTLYTEQGRILGTPEYMSPEQAETTGILVDTRTDIYSLGAMLYELLAGSLPFDSRELRAAGYFEMQRMIREEDPPRPSTKCSTVAASSDVVARRRRSAPRELVRSLEGDLDWITMRCLEKDPARRYQSASELAADLQRHLDHEPVTAGPPSAGYRMRKFLRKRRGVVAAAAAFVLALVSGLALALWQYGVARAAQVDATTAAELADERREEAERQRDEAMKVTELLCGVLRFGDSRLQESAEPTIEQAVEVVAGKLQKGRLFGRPTLVAALLHQTTGMAFRHNRKFSEAEPHLREALRIYEELLGEADPKTVAARFEFGQNLQRFAEDRSRPEQERDDLYRRCNELAWKNIELYRAGRTPPTVEVAGSHRLANYSKRYIGESLLEYSRRAKTGVGVYYEGLELVRKLAPSRARDAEEAWILHQMAGDPDVALPLDQSIEFARESLRLRSEGIGRLAWDTGYSVGQLMSLLLGRWRSVDRRATDSPEIRKLISWGMEFDKTPESRLNSHIRNGGTLLRMALPEEAADQFDKAVTLARSIQPPPSPNLQLIEALDGHAAALRAAGMATDAAAREAEIDRICSELANGGRPKEWLSRFYWGRAWPAASYSLESHLGWIQRHAQQIRANRGEGTRGDAWGGINAAEALLRVGRTEQAESLLSALHESSKEKGWSRGTSRTAALLSFARGLRDPAARCLVTNAGMKVPGEGEDPIEKREFVFVCMAEAMSYLAVADWQGAQETLSKALRVLERGRAFGVAFAQVMLETLCAAAEQGLGRLDEAEELLRSAYARARQWGGDLSFHAAYVDCQLAVLYADTARPDKARELLQRALPRLREAVGEKNRLVVQATGKLKN